MALNWMSLVDDFKICAYLKDKLKNEMEMVKL